MGSSFIRPFIGYMTNNNPDTKIHRSVYWSLWYVLGTGFALFVVPHMVDATLAIITFVSGTLFYLVLYWWCGLFKKKI